MLSQGASPLPLPQELLENIFGNLDIESVLSLRLACRAFHNATTSIWLYFAREIQSRPQNPRSEEPLEDYTSEELQRWVLHRYRVEQVWSAPSDADFRVRKTEISVHDPVVLPGGRWLLSINGWGEILVVDMDSPQMEPRILVKVSLCIEGTKLEDPPGRLTTWVDPHAPRLTFRLALANLGSSNGFWLSNKEGRSRVHIFHGSLQGHGKDATLFVEPIRRYEGVFTGGVKWMTVNDRYFVQVNEKLGHWLGEEEPKLDMYVFACDRDFYTRVRLYDVDDVFVNVFIPSDDTIAFIGGRGVYIYAIPTSSEVPGSEWHPIHLFSVDWPRYTWRCEPYIGKTSTTIVYSPQNDVMAVELPHNLDEPAKVTSIATFFDDFSDWRKLGPFDALSRYNQSAKSGKCCLLRFLWNPLSDEGLGGASISQHEFEISPSILPPEYHFAAAHSFHATTGRLVVISRTENLLYVYDIVPVGGLKDHEC